jgi:hypothetical protein
VTLSLELWLPPLVGGLALLLLGGVWHVVARDRRQRRSRQLLRAALADPDPLARLAAVQVAVQQGISPVAGELLNATRTEEDAAVLEGITEAVARHQWEPAHEPELLELRLWAQRRLVELRVEQRASRRRPTNGAVHHDGAPAPAPGSLIRWLLGERTGAARSRRRG